MGEEVYWERQVDLDGTFIKLECCSWYHNFLIGVLELKDAFGLHGDSHLQTILDCREIISQDQVRSPLFHNEDIVFGDLRSNNILYIVSEHFKVFIEPDEPLWYYA